MSSEAEKKFWATPELVEQLLPHLDLNSTRCLAEVHQMTPTHVEVSYKTIIEAQNKLTHVLHAGGPVSGRLSLWPRSEVVCGSDLEAEVSAGDAGQVRAGGGAV